MVQVRLGLMLPGFVCRCCASCAGAGSGRDVRGCCCRDERGLLHHERRARWCAPCRNSSRDDLSSFVLLVPWRHACGQRRGVRRCRGRRCDARCRRQLCGRNRRSRWGLFSATGCSGPGCALFLDRGLRWRLRHVRLWPGVSTSTVQMHLRAALSTRSQCPCKRWPGNILYILQYNLAHSLSSVDSILITVDQ
jgi:hypothetical protein